MIAVKSKIRRLRINLMMIVARIMVRQGTDPARRASRCWSSNLSSHLCNLSVTIYVERLQEYFRAASHSRELVHHIDRRGQTVQNHVADRTLEFVADYLNAMFPYT